MMVSRKWSRSVIVWYCDVAIFLYYPIFSISSYDGKGQLYVQRRLKSLLQFLHSLFTLSYFILFKWIFILFFKISDANKRKRLSGFQYRKMSKAKKEREENLVRKTTKLDTYFKIKVSVNFNFNLIFYLREWCLWFW